MRRMILRTGGSSIPSEKSLWLEDAAVTDMPSFAPRWTIKVYHANVKETHVVQTVKAVALVTISSHGNHLLLDSSSNVSDVSALGTVRNVTMMQVPKEPVWIQRGACAVALFALTARITLKE